MKRKIKETVTHQGIGGKYIEIEKRIFIADILDTNFNDMNIAMVNFIGRRGMDLYTLPESTRVFYGHVDGLGYYVSEDELEEEGV